MNEKTRNPYAVDAFVPLSGFALLADHFLGLPGVILHKFKGVFLLAARVGRLALVRAGIPVDRPVLVLTCPERTEPAGLFSEFGSVLLMLNHYERWKPIYAGVRVDFRDQGLYFDPASGPNWWNYYFEDFPAAPARSAANGTGGKIGSVVVSRRAENALSRATGAALIERYIRVRPQIVLKADAFAQANFRDRFVIGVHYRGTDKIKEAPRMTYESACAGVRAQIAKARAGQRVAIFVATDEQRFLDFIARAFPGSVCHCDAIRSQNGLRVHDGDADNRRKGEEAIVDCLLLSRCQLLIRTESNLGLCASFFNPAIAQVLLSRSR